MKNVYTVKQVNSYIKNMFTQDFMLNRIYIKGEVSNCKYHTSGHIYFSLKDESGMIACVMFAGNRSGLSFRLQGGQQIIALGNVNVYERDGKYQVYVKEIVREGTGALYEKFEALKKELREMGMFADEYKQQIPRYSHTVGIVTAPTGAAIRDIINVASRRNPFVQLILCPAQVQGEDAAQSIVRGIQLLDQKKVDVIIVGRGGGSIEDLWAFNEECVARAVFECRTPVISAIGHETDTTITDYVADLRAPTPSAAAELAVFDLMETKQFLRDRKNRFDRQIRLNIDNVRKSKEYLGRRLRAAHPRQRMNESRQYTADLENRLRISMKSKLTAEKHKLALMIEKMKGLSPLLKLEQGYAYVQTDRGINIKSVSQTVKGDKIDIFVHDGCIRAEVITSKQEVYGGRAEERNS